MRQRLRAREMGKEAKAGQGQQNRQKRQKPRKVGERRRTQETGRYRETLNRERAEQREQSWGERRQSE